MRGWSDTEGERERDDTAAAALKRGVRVKVRVGPRVGLRLKLTLKLRVKVRFRVRASMVRVRVS